MQTEHENVDVWQLIWNERDFEQAQTLIQDNPGLLDQRNEHGSTLLHVLCCCVREGEEDEDAAIALANRMLALRPELAMEVNNVGFTALHYCVRPSLSDELIPPSTRMACLLIDTFTEAVNITDAKNEFTPFHFACNAGADISLLRRMLEINPLLASKLSNPPNNTENAFYNTPLMGMDGKSLGPLLQKVSLVYAAAFPGSVAEDNAVVSLSTLVFTLRGVHALVSYPSAFFLQKVLLEATDTNRQALLEQDDEGNLPIHIAVQSVFVNEDWERQNQSAVQGAKREWASAVAKLVEAAPDTALIPNAAGRLPMFLALDCTGMTWNGELIVKLAKANPLVLDEQEEATKLYPALYAAMRAPADEDSPEHLSVIYELFKKTPDRFLSGHD